MRNVNTCIWKDISKHYNMRVEVFEDEQSFISAMTGGTASHKDGNKEQNGYTQTFEVYGCALTAVDANIKHAVRINIMLKRIIERNKVMKINEQWDELRENSCKHPK